MKLIDVLLPATHTVLYLANVALAATLSCAAALLAAWAWPRRSAPTRSGLLLLGLVLVLTSPALVWFAARAEIGRLEVPLGEDIASRDPRHAVQDPPCPPVDARQESRIPESEAAREGSAIAAELPTTPPDAWRGSSPGPSRTFERAAEEVANTPPAAPGGLKPEAPAKAALPWWPLGQGLALVWAAGAAMSFLWMLYGLARLAAFGRGLSPAGGSLILPSVRRAAAHVGLARLPRLFLSAHIATPITFGLLRPAIVLPRGLAEELAPDQLYAILVHEMAHVVRRDAWTGLAQRLAAALFWWCPLVHRLNWRLADVREELCDSYVLRGEGEGRDFAAVLVALAERVVRPERLPATAGLFEHRRARERSRALEQRIRRLLSTKANPMTSMNRVSRAWVATLGLAMTVGICLSQVRAAGDTATADRGPAPSSASAPATNTADRPRQSSSDTPPDSGPAAVIAEIEKSGGRVVRDEGRPEKPVTEVRLCGRRCTDALVERLNVFDGLQKLDLDRTRVTEAGVSHLKSLEHLQSLAVSSQSVHPAFLDRLRELPQLRSLQLHFIRIDDGNFQQMATLSQLKSLDLRSSMFHESGLADLAQMTQLEELNLQETFLNDRSFRPLKALSRLQRLDLRRTQITDAGLKQLAELTQLRDLNLMGTKATDAGLAHLAGLPHLVHLDLANTRVTDAGLIHLQRMAQLQTLNLSRTKVTDAGLAQLAGLTRMVHLDVSGTQLTDDGLKHLHRMSKLRWLDLRGTKLTEAALKHLGGLTALEDLGQEIRFSDTGLACLQGLTKLQGLDLRQASVTDAGLRPLRGLTELQRLDLRDTPITDAGLEHLRGLPRLEDLDLTNTKVTGSGLVHIAKLEHLRRLDLHGTRVTDDGLSHLRGLTQLDHLSLDGALVTDAGLAQLSGLTQLAMLHLGATQITDDGLKHLSRLTRLLVLELVGTNVTGTGLAHLHELKQLQYLYLDGSKGDVAAVGRFKLTMPQVDIDPWFLVFGWENPARAANLHVTPATRKILAALVNGTQLELTNTPLADAVAILAKQQAIPIRLDEPQLRAAGVASNVPITRSLTEINLDCALRRVSTRLNLTYVLRDDAVVITSAEEGRRLAPQGVITAEEVKRELGRLGPSHSRIAVALQTDTEIDCKEAPLSDTVQYLRDYHKIPIEFDQPSFAAAGLNPQDVPCTLRMEDVTLEEALNKLLGDLGLTYVIEDEVIRITVRKKTPATDNRGAAGAVPR